MFAGFMGVVGILWMRKIIRIEVKTWTTWWLSSGANVAFRDNHRTGFVSAARQCMPPPKNAFTSFCRSTTFW